MLGPIEFLAIEFPGNKFKGEIAPELNALVDSKTIKIIDFVFVMKDEKGNSRFVELESVDRETARFFDRLGIDVSGLISEEDIVHVAASLTPNSSAAFLLVEHLWVKKLRDAILHADGRMVMDERIPVAVIEQAMASRKLEAQKHK